MRTKVMMTGGGGFVGRVLVDELLADGYAVSLAVRSPLSRDDVAQHVVPDFECIDDDDWAAVLGVTSPDVIVHLAGRAHVTREDEGAASERHDRVNREATLSLARQAAAHGVRRFVFVSSIKVSGSMTVAGSPFRPDGLPGPDGPYGHAKHRAEMGLRELAASTPMDVVIVRPPLVYGPGVRANFRSLLQAAERRLPLPIGRVRNRRSMIYVRNLTAFLRLCMHHPAAGNETFLVSDGHDLSTAELFRELSSQMGRKDRMIGVPLPALRVALTLIGKRDAFEKLCGSLQVDTSNARDKLGWMPPFSHERGVKATVRHFLEDAGSR